MSRTYLDEITNDIAESYAKMTGQNEDWKKHISLSDFFELRKQAIIEIEKNFSFGEEHQEKQPREIKVEKKSNKKAEENPPQQTNEVNEKPSKKEETSKQPIVVESQKQNEPTTITTSTEQVETSKSTQTIETTPYDARHDKEELALFSRLKD